MNRENCSRGPVDWRHASFLPSHRELLTIHKDQGDAGKAGRDPRTSPEAEARGFQIRKNSPPSRRDIQSDL